MSDSNTQFKTLRAFGEDEETALARLESMVKHSQLGTPDCVACNQQWKHPSQPPVHVATASFSG
jgi:hypothetical protein